MLVARAVIHGELDAVYQAGQGAEALLTQASWKTGFKMSFEKRG